MAITYRITPQPNQHIYNISLTFTATAAHQELKLPVWIPGSYMVREFSKQVLQVIAVNGDYQVLQLGKNEWNITGLTIGAKVEISYQVYAYEYGIRTAFLDFNRGYFNPTSLCLVVIGNESSQHSVIVEDLPANWQVATGLTEVTANTYIAKDYDELIDCPFELGALTRISFNVDNVPHYLILSGTIPEFDQQRMIADMQKVCEYQIRLFGGIAPYSSYTFILNLSGEIYTGLEHRNSTLLMAPYYALPNLIGSNDIEYFKLMGLISHEFFHTWNVKRIKPKVFTPYDLYQENYTKLLWWFEGVTSYYDDLVLYRSGVITQEQYLQIIADNINNVYKFNGARIQSVANSSLTSWIKYYRQDENSPNSIASYYVKGSLVALCLDLMIREQSIYSLDDVMLYLYKEWCNNPVGIGEDEIPSLIKAATGVDLTRFIYEATETTAELPFSHLFAAVGLELNQRRAKNHQDSGKYYTTTSNKASVHPIIDLGVRIEKLSLGYLVKNVYSGGSGDKIGLAAGDIILAINQVKLSNFDQQISFYNSGNEVMLTLFRQERLINLSCVLEESVADIVDIGLVDRGLLSNWL